MPIKALYLSILATFVCSIGLCTDKMSDRVKILGGKVFLDGSVETSSALQIDKYTENVNISTPTTPATNHSRTWLNGSSRQICTVFDNGTTNCVGSGSGTGTITGVTAGSGLNGGGTTGNVTLNLTSPISNSSIDSSSVTKQGNVFNGASQLVQTSGSGLITNGIIDVSSITKQGQNVIFLTSSLQSGATFYVSSGSVSGTMTAGTFSGSGASLTSLNASNLTSGTVGDARLSSNVELLDSTQTVTGVKTWISPSVSSFTYGLAAGSLTLTGLTASLPVQTNASKLLTSAAIDLSGSQVTGNLATSHLNTGTGATSSTFWRGDGSWATPAGSGSGTIAQIVKASVTSSSSTTSAAFIPTALSVTITPTLATSSITVYGMCPLQVSNVATNVSFITLERGSTNLFGSQGFTDCQGGATGNLNCPVSWTFTDAPNTTASTTYKIFIRSSTAGQTSVLNVQGDTCNIEAHEIKA